MPIDRRTLLASAMAFGSVLAAGRARARDITPETVANELDAPSAGNPRGDVTIVAFLDYNCPYCKKSSRVLDRLLQTDGGVKLVYKDCPVLGEASEFGARMALAAAYQGAYRQAHDALMRLPGGRSADLAMAEAIEASGVDIARLQSDLGAHGAQIDALIKRNIAEARALGFDGVPDFLVGPFPFSGSIDFETLSSTVAQIRATEPVEEPDRL